MLPNLALSGPVRTCQERLRRRLRRSPTLDRFGLLKRTCRSILRRLWPVANLQRLNGWGLGLRRFGFEAEAGLGEESVDEGGPVLDALEPVLHDRGEPVRRAAGA